MLRVPIRLKVGGALATPLLALFAVTVLEVRGAAGQVNEVREQTELAEAAIGPSGAITRLQDERRWSAVELVGGQQVSAGDAASYAELRGRTDRALADLRREIGQKGTAVRTAFQPAFAALDSLAALRAEIDGSTTPRTPQTNLTFSRKVFDSYSDIITAVFDATTRISLVVRDGELRQGTALADAVARQIDTMSILIMDLYVTGSTPGGVDTPDEIEDLSVLRSAFERNAEGLRTAGGRFATVANHHYPAELTDKLTAVVDRAIATTRVDALALSTAVDKPAGGDYTRYQEAVADAILRRSHELNGAARSRQHWFMTMAALVLILAAAVALVVSRAITRPLRSLTRQARDIARDRLPEAVATVLATPLGGTVATPAVTPVRVDSHDEVSDLVATLDRVQHVALDLAVEQVRLQRSLAETFVNLGRRNQNLLGRQLDFITTLEGNETDPNVLANLFNLDHLATRMRRNAESLLVLAGAEPSRQWAAPVPLTHVVRAALGEVEDYGRVSLRDVEPITVVGFVAADLTHLLAELIENALVFSEQDSGVVIRGQRGAHRPWDARAVDQYALAVIDSGRGMSPSEVAAANRRLAGTERFTVAPSKYLGHYVAGQLARRHGVTIELESAAWIGTTAVIYLPNSLLISPMTATPGTFGPDVGRTAAPLVVGEHGAPGRQPARSSGREPM